MAAIEDLVFRALSRELELSEPEVRLRRLDDLARLGLDSHALMRVLLELEQQLALDAPLELDDAALVSPDSMVAGVAMRLGRT